MSTNGVVEVRAPVTGNVWQVLVAVGDQIDVGQELVILESMKMEIPVEAPAAGRIASLITEVGSPVQEGDVLLTIS